MAMRPLVLAAMMGVASLAGVHAPEAQARTYVGVDVRVAPPPPRYERVRVRPGYVWAPGHWRWDGRRYYWIGGSYVPARRGYVYVAPRWNAYGPAWRFNEGHWRRR
ncbi:YXWGXW repeat-containing protein [Lysobacter capsici]|uniref:YXWGXW repeat-containing protein n=1 Tax=Lysobacter capsici TaxID=435897 RepID=UPI00287B7D47|nr:YXWGXW repeat-containing protein [Lysobacter capsici]WND78534.1 YXWGXW repeat-containing protein [Lysobacter capsici]WND83729.1 YXWGXW repeat-containing protein [Lysobacter capsici]